MIWLGAATNRYARWRLGTNYRSRLTVVDDHAVIEDGPYRFVRHPMYSGILLICSGAAIAVSAPASVLWAMPVVSIIRRIQIEESRLRRELGSTYDDFARRRARLLPGIW